MNKKTTASLVCALTLGAVSSRVHATTTTVAPALSVTVAPAFVSEYMFRGQRLSGSSFQPYVEATYGNAGLGVWTSFPIEDKNTDSADPEIDPYGYYTFNVNENFSIVPGFSLYVYPNADTSAGGFRSTFEPSLAVNYTTSFGLRLTPKLYYDVTLDGPTGELTAAFSVPLKDLGTELDFSATYGEYLQKDVANGATPAVKTWGAYWSVGVTAPFQINKDSRLVVGFAYQKGEDSFVKQGTSPQVANPLAMGRGVVSVSYSWTF